MRRRFTGADLLAIALLFAGFCFRLWASPHARLTGDEAHYWATSRALARFEIFPLLGPEISGTAARLPGPLYYWFMAIPQVLGDSPLLGASFVALGHTLAALGLYDIAEREGRAQAGLFAVALFAFAPWDVLYADRIWGSCVVPIFASAALYGALRATPFWQGVTVFVSLALPQLHLSTPVLWLALFVILLLRPPKLAFRAIGIGVLVAALTYVPYLVYELGSGFQNTRAIFQKAGGNAEKVEPLAIVLKTFGNAFLYGTGEIGYHFARGYWGGGFDELATYGTAAGLRGLAGRQGSALGLGLALSAIVAAGAFAGAAFHLARSVVRRLAREPADAAAALGAGCLVAVSGAAFMIVAAKKIYFPHYTNLLVPMIFLPLGDGLARLTSGRARPLGLVALALSMTTMAASAAKYYLEIDRLNGVGATLAMVEQAFSLEKPFSLAFTHFNNGYSWGEVARTIERRGLPFDDGAELRVIVHNDRPFEGEPPAGSVVFDGVLVEVAERARPKPPGLVFRARDSVVGAEVTAKTPAGTRACRVVDREGCAYGDHEWQHLRPDHLKMGGRDQPILFLHPISRGEVTVRFSSLPAARRGVLFVGLSDESVDGTPRNPVSVRLREGANVLVEAEAGERQGLLPKPFARTSTAPLELTIGVADDGARVFGFDLELYAR